MIALQRLEAFSGSKIGYGLNVLNGWNDWNLSNPEVLCPSKSPNTPT
jgi:hypothetical protein